MRWGLKPRRKPTQLSAEWLLPPDQIAFGGLNVLASLRYDDYRSVTTNYLQNGDKAGYLRIASPNDWARFMPSTMDSRRLSATQKGLPQYRRRAR